jgi:transketolase
MEEKARLIRRNIMLATYFGGSGHPGGSLSCADMLSALYFGAMRVDARRPDMPDRDRFVLSKAHAASALYGALCERGYFGHELLRRFGREGSPLQRHMDMHKVPGVDVSAGSLGQGFSVACGMALAARMDGAPWRVYVLLGDGELDEGSNWEAAMSAAHFALGNLTVLVDRNCLQIDGTTEEIMGLEPLKAKWEAFGFSTLEIDGHDMAQVAGALRAAGDCGQKPVVILARTVKGKGVSFMENRPEWHSGSLSRDQAEKALRDLGFGGEALC